MIVTYNVTIDKLSNISIGALSIPETRITVEGTPEQVMEIIKVLSKELKLS
jgi:hypothetical protein